ncbi:MAG: hypothetical protein EPN82_16050 [Bacteroidetes bacterium]|nr:MAG: hypothetical protein EPN82_16050 [Bacteroidota bacterium]
MKKTKFQSIIVIIVTLFFIVYVPFLTIKDKGFYAGAMSFFAADSFYYLNVADKFSKTNTYTSDSSHLTNGFHPLWQYFLANSFKYLHSQESQIKFAFLISLLCIVIGFCIISYVLFKITGNIGLSVLGSVPGFYYLIFSFVDQKYYSPWSYINSMETPFTIIMFSLLLLYFIRKNDVFDSFNSKMKLIFLSFCLTLLTLARLDDIFIFIPFFIFIYIQTGKISEFIRNALIASIIPILLIGAYLIFNLSYSGMLIPVSGAYKSGFSLINFAHFINVFFPIGIINPEKFYIWINWSGSAHRVLQVFILFLTSIGFLLTIWKKYDLKIKELPVVIQIFCFFGLYLIGKSLYNILFVNIWFQSFWYFPIGIIWINIIITYYLSKKVPGKPIINFLLIVIVLVISNKFANNQGSSFDLRYQNKWFQQNQYAAVWEKRKILQDSVNIYFEGKGLIEIDDGIIAYSFYQSVFNGLGICIDKEAFDSLKKSQPLEIAYQRGYKLIASSYYIILPDSILENSTSINEFLKKGYFKSEKINWNFSLLFHDKETNFNLIKIEKKLIDN